MGIVLQPTDGQGLIPKTDVAGCLLSKFCRHLWGQMQEPKGAHAVLEGSHYHIANGGHNVRIVDVQGGGSGHKTASIDPNQNWEPVCGVLRISIVDQVVCIPLLSVGVLPKRDEL